MTKSDKTEAEPKAEKAQKAKATEPAPAAEPTWADFEPLKYESGPAQPPVPADFVKADPAPEPDEEQPDTAALRQRWEQALGRTLGPEEWSRMVANAQQTGRWPDL